MNHGPQSEADAIKQALRSCHEEISALRKRTKARDSKREMCFDSG